VLCFVLCVQVRYTLFEIPKLGSPLHSNTREDEMGGVGANSATQRTMDFVQT
jgi:hypothetical protein